MQTKPIYTGIVINLNVDTVTLPNGLTVDLEVVRHPGAAAVVPLKDDGMVILIRQFRHAAGGFIYEIPAGKLHANLKKKLDTARAGLISFPASLPHQGLPTKSSTSTQRQS